MKWAFLGLVNVPFSIFLTRQQISNLSYNLVRLASINVGYSKLIIIDKGRFGLVRF
jgi:hypothetical protein